MRITIIYVFLSISVTVAIYLSKANHWYQSADTSEINYLKKR